MGYWGITVSQVRDILDLAAKDSSWTSDKTMRDLVEGYVKPMTKGKGVGYALLKNMDSPKLVNVFVSHSWQENAEDFYQTLERSVQKDEIMFICAFSLYQCEDGVGPSIKEQLGKTPEESPFQRVLMQIQLRGNQKMAFWQRSSHWNYA